MRKPELASGFGAGAITPDVPVFLAGFAARTEPAVGVHDELEAHAVVFEHNDSRLLLVVCDLLGMSPEVATDVRTAVAAAVDLPLERVLSACTHTHTGPSVLRGSERLGWPTPEGYERRVADGCVVAARAAVASAESFLWPRRRSPDAKHRVDAIEPAAATRASRARCRRWFPISVPPI